MEPREVGSVDFDVAVGTAVPRGRIQIIPVPETLVQIEPEWRGFLYFIVRDELVIVNPQRHENRRCCSGVIGSKTAKRSEGGIKPPSLTRLCQSAPNDEAI